MSKPEVQQTIIPAESDEKDVAHNHFHDTKIDGRTSSEATSSEGTFTSQEKKSIIRKIDLRVVILLGAIYSVSLIDRSQIGLAMIAGMGVDLQLIGNRYNIINAVFFAPYVLLQLPSTVILRKMGPRNYLAMTAMAWGLATIASGFVRSWTDMVALRMVLGACEAGFFPACVYLLSVWYPRYDLQRRHAGLLILGLIPAAFAGILAFAISHLEGDGSGPKWWGSINKTTGEHNSGLAGWRWIFIIYGVATCVMSIIAWFFLVDFPEKIVLGTAQKSWTFLSKDEAAWAVERIEKDRRDVMPTEFQIREYLKHIWELDVWAYGVIYMLQGIIGYGIGYSLPFLLEQGMGFSTAASQCLVTPPYLLASAYAWFVAVWADKSRRRSPFVLFNGTIAIIGLCLIGFVKTVGVRYFGVFLAAVPSIANAPCILTWQANNVRGQWKRALVSALSVGFGAIGGVIGSLIFRLQDQPQYIPGIAACIGAGVIMIVIVLLLDLKYIRANRRAAAGGKLVEGLAGFQYTL